MVKTTEEASKEEVYAAMQSYVTRWGSLGISQTS